MELDVVADRAIVGVILRAITGSDRTSSSRRGPYAPPSWPSGNPPLDDLHSSEIAQLCRTLLHELLLGHDRVAGLEDELAPDVVLWTPGTFASTNVAVLGVLLRQDWDDGPLSDLAVTVTEHRCRTAAGSRRVANHRSIHPAVLRCRRCAHRAHGPARRDSRHARRHVRPCRGGRAPPLPRFGRDSRTDPDRLSGCDVRCGRRAPGRGRSRPR